MMMKTNNILAALLLLCIASSSHALSIISGVSRRQWITAASGAAFIGASTLPATAADSSTKLTNLSNEELAKIIQYDIDENQFLVTGKITRQVYDESCTFQDEIDTYGMDQWIVGTGRLFVGDKSALRLVGPIQVSDEEVKFAFDEDLMFNIPLKPVVHLTGKLELKRDPSTGLITSYKEIWDQGVWDVLKTAKI